MKNRNPTIDEEIKVKPSAEEVKEFLMESNAIESVYGAKSLEESLAAWKYITKIKVLTPEEVMATHGIYMKRLDPKVAGKLRDYPVWIGGNMKPFISYQLLYDGLKEVCDFINDSIKKKNGTPMKDRLEICKKAHIMMEHWHGFGDGNGRLRIIYNWHRMKMGLPIHIIHEGDEQMSYYSWFK